MISQKEFEQNVKMRKNVIAYVENKQAKGEVVSSFLLKYVDKVKWEVPIDEFFLNSGRIERAIGVVGEDPKATIK